MKCDNKFLWTSSRWKRKQVRIRSKREKQKLSPEKFKIYSSLHLVARNHDNIVVSNIVCLASRLKQRSHESAGFYLGYLRGRSIPHPPPQKKLQYVSNYIGKIIQTRRGQGTWRKYSLSKDTIVSQNALNAPDCISAHIHLKKFPAPPKKLVAFGHSGLLPQTINPRLNPDPGIFEIAYFFTRISLPSTRNQWIPTPRTYFFETALYAERFKTPSTRSRIKNKRVQKCSDK